MNNHSESPMPVGGTVPSMDFLYFRGRVGLYAALKSLGVKSGDHVAIQAFTCIAVPEAVMATGAKPLFIDIAAASVNMSADDLRRKITPQTRAIVIQHTFGIPAELDSLIAIADEHGLPLIEDCCHTLTATYHGKTVGTFGDAAFYSFEWGKPLVAGVGGALHVENADLRAKLAAEYESVVYPKRKKDVMIAAQYYAHAILYRPSTYWTVRGIYRALSKSGAVVASYNPVDAGAGPAPDFSWRMSRFSEGNLKAKLPRMNDVTAAAKRVAAGYAAAIPATAAVRPLVPDHCDAVYARYPLFVSHRDELAAEAQNQRVELATWYATPVHPLHDNEWHLVNYTAGSCPNAERHSQEIVSLPVHSKVTDRNIAAAGKLLREHAARYNAAEPALAAGSSA